MGDGSACQRLCGCMADCSPLLHEGGQLLSHQPPVKYLRPCMHDAV